ncbi:precorrin-3B C(17)-methyltransferase [Nitratidesulfovibrio vulgaris]|uniref:precorrin-3B C(17)-methyltransferase n=1 Tax=Nitratidesulfovibrio vulgaris TaxID=881 RepID=UPI002301C2EA|nr:precorrin-3B C(17)-methyltransferase [Nitratidesulfovibrio vulgaris]WCB46561.1 precorrin-3B C(17)-methyltransferase [Nitratidesulfovibrio vulgaris]
MPKTSDHPRGVAPEASAPAPPPAHGAQQAPASAAAPAPLAVVGLGPGDASLLTPQALAALEAADVVVGYTLYVRLIPEEVLQGKTVLSTGMMAEMQRCEAAIDSALAGRPTAVVCSGDPGIYAMAGLVFELLEERGLAETLPVTVVPGIPAVCGAAALLGAPLMHDFACVSLSDLLTPWEVIERRAGKALEADFVLVLYNPRSKRRDWQLGAVMDRAKAILPPATPVGVVRDAYRPGQAVFCRTLSTFDPAEVDMLSIVVIGNSATRLVGGRMVTPRGYMEKYR